MPELPEVETVMRGLAPALTGRRIVKAEVRRPDLRFPFPPRFAERLTGRRFEGFTRRAKYILARLDNGEVLLVHLGMTGRFTLSTAAGRTDNLGEFYFESPGGDGAHDHVVLTFDDGGRAIYTDPRRFGMMDLFPESEMESHRLLKDIGVEPLGNGLHAAYLAAAFAGKSAPLKAALLDQSIIAGLGNIYVCEALFRAGFSPLRKAASMATAAKLEPLIIHIRTILSEAIRAGGSTLKDFAQADGSDGSFQQAFQAYGREGEACLKPGCKGRITRVVQSGRSTFYCPKCQR